MSLQKALALSPTTKLARASLETFAKTFLPHYLRDRPAKFHQQIFKTLESIGGSFGRVAIAAPRGHAKSSIVSLFYVLWVLLYGKKKFVVLLSDTATQAESLMASIRKEIQDNPAIVRAFGEMSGGLRWTNSDAVLANGCRVVARGANTSLRGFRWNENRPDLIVCDDLENDEAVRSAEQRAQLHDWYSKVVENAGDNRFSLVVTIGTILHPHSLMSDLVKSDKWPGYRKFLFRAIADDGQSLWPERFSIDELARIKRDIGSFAFACEYQNNPVDEESKMFRLQDLRYYTVAPPDLDVVIAVDPAISTKTQADWFAAAIIGVDSKTRNYYLLHMFRQRAGIRDNLRAVVSLAKRYEARMIAVEEVQFQAVLQPLLKEELKAQGVSCSVRGVKNVTDKRMRIVRLQPVIETNQLYVLENQKDFIEELDMYPSVAHDDQLDALEMAIRCALKSPARMELI